MLLKNRISGSHEIRIRVKKVDLLEWEIRLEEGALDATQQKISNDIKHELQEGHTLPKRSRGNPRYVSKLCLSVVLSVVG